MGRARDWLRALVSGLDLPGAPGGGSWSRFTPSSDPEGGTEERERAHEAESAAISGLADMLEARYRAREVASNLEDAGERRSRDGFRDEPDANLAYDFAAFGMHTIKTLLELNVRAHRKLTDTLRAAAKASEYADEGRDALVQPTQVVELVLGPQAIASSEELLRLLPLGEFELVNQRGRRLGLEFESGCTFSDDDDTKAVTMAKTGKVDLQLVFLPARVDLEAGASRKVKVYLDARKIAKLLVRRSEKAETLTGTIGTRRLHGDRAPIQARLTIESKALEERDATRARSVVFEFVASAEPRLRIE